MARTLTTINIEDLGPATRLHFDYDKSYRVTFSRTNWKGEPDSVLQFDPLAGGDDEAAVKGIVQMVSDVTIYDPKTEWWQPYFHEVRRESTGTWYVSVLQEWLD
jgi:hypothetical protein